MGSREKVLFVDDDALILKDFTRLFGRRYQVNTAQNVSEAMSCLHRNGPFAVVISDLKMPVVDGVQFFKRLRETASDTTRILLTGHGSLDAAMDAINHGHIFRFLTKPCPPEVLDQAIQAGLKQYHLVVAERELLENTLQGAVNMLVGVLGLTNPLAFNRAARIRPMVQSLAEIFQPPSPWEWETAAMLSQIGCITVFPEILENLYRDGALPDKEQSLFNQHPMVGARLIRPIPRMETVAEIIANQERRFDGQGPGNPELEGETIPLASRVLKVVLDHDLAGAAKPADSEEQLLAVLEKRIGWYDPKVLRAFRKVAVEPRLGHMRPVTAGELNTRMVLGADLIAKDGRILLRNGNLVTQAIIERINIFRHGGGLQEPIQVYDLL